MSAAALALWERLRQAALVEGEPPAPDDERVPWFIRVMLGIAGWIGALFLLGFVGVAVAVAMEHAAVAIAMGAGACAAAGALFRVARGDFSAQFAFAVSLAGQALLAFGLGRMIGHSSIAAVAALVAVQQALLFWLIPSYGHRVWCAGTSVYAALFALGEAGLGMFGPALVTAAFVALWLREFDLPGQGRMLRAAGYGLALAMLATAVQGGLWHTVLQALGGSRGHAAGVLLARLGAFASAAVLLWSATALMRREHVPLGSPRGRAALAAAAIVAAASLEAPGLAPGTAILVLGYANGNRLLVGAGIAALAAYLSFYYYALDRTLLEKSALLFCTGLALLAVRIGLRRWWSAQEAGRA